MTQRSDFRAAVASPCRWFVASRAMYIWRMTRGSVAGPMRPHQRIRYGRPVNWILRQIERLRSFNPLVVDGVLAAILLVLGLVTVYTQDVKDGMVEPSDWAVATILIVVAPICSPPSQPAARARRRLLRNPVTHRLRLAGGLVAAVGDAPHLHRCRVELAAAGCHRARVRLRHADPARHHRYARARHARRRRQHGGLHGRLGVRDRPAGPPRDAREPAP